MKKQEEQVKSTFKRAENICMSVRLEAESHADTVSITIVAEKLDIEAMLNRAQQGILDLRTYQRPMTADYVAGSNDDQTARDTIELLNELDSPLNRVFGTDRESVVQAGKEFARIANDNRVVKSKENEEEGSSARSKEEPPNE